MISYIYIYIYKRGIYYNYVPEVRFCTCIRLRRTNDCRITNSKDIRTITGTQ